MLHGRFDQVRRTRNPSKCSRRTGLEHFQDKQLVSVHRQFNHPSVARQVFDLTRCIGRLMSPGEFNDCSTVAGSVNVLDVGFALRRAGRINKLGSVTWLGGTMWLRYLDYVARIGNDDGNASRAQPDALWLAALCGVSVWVSQFG